jgi:ATP-dependent DNA helicase RecQ
MGFDKRTQLCYSLPGAGIGDRLLSAGGAGRASDPAAYGVLLSGPEEIEINSYFIENAFPSRNEAQLVLDALQNSAEGLSVPIC